MNIEIHYKDDNEATIRYNGSMVTIEDCNKETLKEKVNSLVVAMLFQMGMMGR